jgi:hypothetical protein
VNWSRLNSLASILVCTPDLHRLATCQNSHVIRSVLI